MSEFEVEYSGKQVDSHVRNISDAKHIAQRTGRRAEAIRAHCIECVGGVLRDVRECTDKNCSLYPYRMGYKKCPEAKGESDE